MIKWQGMKEQVLKWIENKRKECRGFSELVGINDLSDWSNERGEIKNKKGKDFFSIKGMRVRGAVGREVENWDQPIIAQRKKGIFAIFCQRQKAVMKYLLQARYEPGLVNKIQLAPTIQTIERNVKYFKFLKSKRAKVIYKVKHSEEGTRFWHKENLNILIELDKNLILPEDDNFMWLTLPQIKKLMLIDNLVNPYVRTVLAPL